MNEHILALAIGNIDDDLIYEAENYVKLRRTKKRYSWLMASVAACLSVLISIGLIRIGLSNYVSRNNIVVSRAETIVYDDYNISYEEGGKIWYADNMHLKLSQKGYKWFGCCYYDLQKSSIMIGLTDYSSKHINTIRKQFNSFSPVFFICDYSNEELENDINLLFQYDTFLRMLGVTDYSISVQRNRISISLSDDNRYAAIFAVNMIIGDRDAVVFECSY